MKKRLIKVSLIASFIGCVLYSALGAAGGLSFGFGLPGGDKYIVQFQFGVQHIVPAPAVPEDEETGIRRLEPEETA